MSDSLATGALEAAAEHAAPPLTTVGQPNEEKGRLAARWLLGDVERGGAPRRRRRRTILPTKLIVRESTAPRPVD